MTNKEKYRRICETEGLYIPLFLQYWWMETVCEGKQWDVALAYDSDGAVSAALPYLIGRKMGLRYVLQPQLTQYNGPWYRPDADIADATAQLVKRIDSLHLALFLQNFSPAIADLDGWRHYDISPRPTYRLDDISDPERVFRGFDPRKRQRQIRKAEGLLHVDDGLSPQDFARLHSEYWASRGKKDLLSQDFITRVVATALGRGNGMLLAARDEQGRIHGARFVAYDADCAYALLSALGKDGHHNGTSAFLFWNIIQRLSSTTKSFDFEGSVDPGIAYSYSLYGSHPAEYHQVMGCKVPFLKKILKIQ